jgi:hypothetical protein
MFPINIVMAWHETYCELSRYNNKYSLLFASRALPPTGYEEARNHYKDKTNP